MEIQTEKGSWFPRGQGLTVSYTEVLPRPWPCLRLLLGARLDHYIAKCQLYKLKGVSGQGHGGVFANRVQTLQDFTVLLFAFKTHTVL